MLVSTIAMTISTILKIKILLPSVWCLVFFYFMLNNQWMSYRSHVIILHEKVTGLLQLRPKCLVSKLIITSTRSSLLTDSSIIKFQIHQLNCQQTCNSNLSSTNCLTTYPVVFPYFVGIVHVYAARKHPLSFSSNMFLVFQSKKLLMQCVSPLVTFYYQTTVE